MATSISIGPASGGAGKATLTIAGVFSFAEASGQAFNYEVKNNESPVFPEIKDLTGGAANTITVPSISGGNKAAGVVIVPPTGNTSSITLKGVSGDTGVGLHLTAPQTLVFPATPPANFVLTLGGSGTIAGFRFFWF